MTKRSRSIGLDPESQYEEIYRNLTLYEFPWDLNQALSFALFRTYAVPSIGRLLDETGAFARDAQKRYDDTSLLLEAPLVDGFESATGKAALRRINQMHKMYDISNEDFLYVLSTFVVVPIRWLQRFGWRRLTAAEVTASVRYYQALGRHMAIRDIPATYEEFEALMDGYEAEHFAFHEGAARVAESTLALVESFYPAIARPAVGLFALAMMDRSLIDAFHFREPGKLARTLSAAALKARARVVALLPPRRRPKRVADLPWVRSYPNGYTIGEMGTFAPGCPVSHSSTATDGQG